MFERTNIINIDVFCFLISVYNEIMRSVDIRKELFLSGRLKGQYEEITACMGKIIYETVNHRIKFETIDLSGDIETNPGPFGVNSSKIICAPYSQGNSVFGSNAGSQCVAMSLTAIL